MGAPKTDLRSYGHGPSGLNRKSRRLSEKAILMQSAIVNSCFTLEVSLNGTSNSMGFARRSGRDHERITDDRPGPGMTD
jgi:hypothetical protein